jgi:hypothetical protein
MKQYRLSAAAENDLFEIWAFIASDNLNPADRLEAEFFAPASWWQNELTSAIFGGTLRTNLSVSYRTRPISNRIRS